MVADWIPTLVAAVAVAVIHLSAARLRAAAPVPHRLGLSGAGGVSIAYVFVHVLPELGAGQRAFGEAGVGVIPFLEHHVYLVAMAGFVAYYGVERVARQGREGDGGAFGAHLGSFAVYNGLIGYFFVHRIEGSLRGLVLFAGAMALHVFVTDAGLARHDDDAYRRYGRWVLAAAIVCGWGIGQVVRLRELAVVALFAFLAGGIVLNVVKEELPEETGGSFAAFVAGAAGYTVVLLSV